MLRKAERGATEWARLLLIGACAGGLCSSPAQGRGATAPTSRTRPRATSAPSVDLARATEDFRAGRYAAARTAFDAARSAAPTGPDAATLGFNAAVCSYALAEYADARARFEHIAATVPELAALARVNAGLAALHAGDLAAADQSAEAPEPLPPDAEARRQTLLEELAHARSNARATELHTLLEAGFDAVSNEHWPEAHASFERALPLIPAGDAEHLADAHYGLGLVAAGLHEPLVARQEFERSLEYRSGDAHAWLALGHSAEDGADRQRAQLAYETALAMPLSDTEQRSAERALLRLYPLPLSGATAFVAVGAGYDDNATQSGVTDVSDTSVDAALPSAYATTFVDVGLNLRTSLHTVLGLNYTGDVLALASPRVDDLSLQSHELVARWQWAPTLGTKLRLDAGGAYVWTGLSPVRPFEWDGVFSAQLDLDTSVATRTRLQVSERLVRGVAYSYLDGQRFAFTASELWRLGRWELSAQTTFRVTAAGTQPIALLGNAYPVCSPNCDRRPYQSPLSYWTPGLGVGAAWLATPGLRISEQTRAEYRGYINPAFLPGVPASRKLRKDWRARATLGAELALDDANRFRLTFDQSLLLSASNVAFSASKAQHRYDYGDHNFLEAATELGVAASLP